jgi:hypothetical protein
LRARQPAAEIGDGVAELIAAERRLAAGVAAAAVAAAASVDEASREAAARTAAAASELTRELEGLRTAATSRLQALLRAEATSAEARLSGWSGVPERRLQQLAAALVETLVTELCAAAPAVAGSEGAAQPAAPTSGPPPAEHTRWEVRR